MPAELTFLHSSNDHFFAQSLIVQPARVMTNSGAMTVESASKDQGCVTGNSIAETDQTNTSVPIGKPGKRGNLNKSL